MAAAAREYFTVDLRGLRAALAARAARQGISESAVLRGALAAGLGTDRTQTSASSTGVGAPMSATQIKLSVRLAKATSCRLDQDARAVGLSRGMYLTRLIAGAPPVIASSDRVAMCNALNASSAELAVLSRDVNRLTQLLRQGSGEAACMSAARHAAMDAVVQAHLARAAPILAELASMRLTARQGVRRLRSEQPT